MVIVTHATALLATLVNGALLLLKVRSPLLR